RPVPRTPRTPAPDPTEATTIRPDDTDPRRAPAPPADPLGATPLPGGGARFVVWAPAADAVEVLVEGHDPVRLAPQDAGYHAGTHPGARAGDRYRYRLHRPDGE